MYPPPCFGFPKLNFEVWGRSRYFRAPLTSLIFVCHWYFPCFGFGLYCCVREVDTLPFQLLHLGWFAIAMVSSFSQSVTT